MGTRLLAELSKAALQVGADVRSSCTTQSHYQRHRARYLNYSRQIMRDFSQTKPLVFSIIRIQAIFTFFNPALGEFPLRRIAARKW